jgi:hypothetical protein
MILVSPRRFTVLFSAVALLGAVGLAWGLALGMGRVVVAAVVLVLFVAMVTYRPALGCLAMLGYVILLGDLRRIFIPLFGLAGQDPILLVVPVVVGLSCVSLFVTRQLRLDTPLSKAVVLLMAVMVLQILNPLQGGLVVGIAGAIFYLVPLGWFWISRKYASEQLAEQVLTLVIALAVLAALVVLVQTFFGFLPFQQAWIDQAGYEALYVGDRVRPFGFSTSASECAHLLAIGAVIVIAFNMKGKSRVSLILLPLIIAGMFLIGSRTIVVKVGFVVALMWAMQGHSWRTWAPRLVLAGLVLVFGLYWSLTQIGDMEVSGQARSMVSHQVNGLLNPLDKEHSTAGIHVSMMLNGFRSAFKQPLGYGLGATTMAAGKFGGNAKSSEVDWSNLGLSLGLPGMLLYGIIIFLTLRALLRVWQRRRSPVALALLGVIFLMGGVWLIGGEYGTTALVWTCIGMMDHFHRNLQSPST